MKEKLLLSGIFAATLIGFATVVSTEVAKSLNPVAMLLLSYLVSSAVLLVWLKARNELNFARLIENKKKIMEVVLSRNVFGALILVYGFSLAPAINVIILLRTETAFILVFSFFFLKEKIDAKRLSALFLVFFGALLLSASGNFSALTSFQLGDLLVLAAMAFTAYSYFPAKKLLEKLSHVSLLAFSNLLSIPFFLAIALIASPSFFPLLDPQISLLLLLSILLFFVFGMSFFYKAIKGFSPWTVSVLLAVSLVSGAALSFFWLGNTLSFVQGFGALLVVFASLLVSFEKKR